MDVTQHLIVLVLKGIIPGCCAYSLHGVWVEYHVMTLLKPQAFFL
jgi:hypothetical protein